MWNKREENCDKLFDIIEPMKPRSLNLTDERLQKKEELGDSINPFKGNINNLISSTPI